MFIIQNFYNIYLWESNLPKYLFPQVYQFPKIIHLCQICYLPSQRAIVFPNQQILFTITTGSINEMLQIQPNPDEAPFSIENLIDLYLKLDLPKISQNFQTFLLEKTQVPTDNPPYSATIFYERTRQIVTMLSCILGYTTDEHVDEPILGFLSIFFPGNPPATVFNFAQLLVDKIHDQLIKLLDKRVFKYSLVLFHRFLYFQSKRFTVNIQNLDTKANPRSVIFWTSLIRKYSTNFNYKDFIDSFVHLVVNMLSSRNQLKVSDEIKKVLQLSKHSKTRHWSLYQNYTKVRVYGRQLTPYKLLKYLLMRIFALEYIRHIINSDDVNFLLAKKKTQFKIKN